jgi:hypothetical protein
LLFDLCGFRRDLCSLCGKLRQNRKVREVNTQSYAKEFSSIQTAPVPFVARLRSQATDSVYNSAAACDLMKTPSFKLVHVVIGKSVLETLLVGALAVFTFITVFPPYFHGWGEVTNDGIAGWVVNNAAPWERVEVELFVDGKFAARAVANEVRTDVVAAGWAKDQWHGYTFPIASQSPGFHEARVYALHDSGHGARKSLQLVGDTLQFFVDQEGRPRRTATPKQR